MRLMNSICIVIAELLDDDLDPVKILLGCQISNAAFKPGRRSVLDSIPGGLYLLESSDFPFIIEFVVQGTLDALVHIDYQLDVVDML